MVQTLSDVLDYVPDGDDVSDIDEDDDEQNNLIGKFDQMNVNEPPELPTNINGSERLQAMLHKLCSEYKDIFSVNVRPQPARKIEPLVLSIDSAA